MWVRWATTDRYPRLARLALGGAVLAFVLAVVGLPAVSIHEPTHFAGIMSPSCGLTRAARFLARADFRQAWRYNPASFLLAAGAALLIARAAIGRLTGRWLEITLRRPLLFKAALAVPVAALWINQQQ